MQIAMLGPLEVRADDGAVVDVPGARLRGLLAALALRPDQVVSKAALVDWIWSELPPADATNALQRLVSRLRKLLPDGSIEGHPDGYRLTVEPDAVDAARFERLVAAARTAAARSDATRRVGLLREALELWRGAPLQDVGLQDSAALDAAVLRLETLRLTTAEERFDAEVSLGRGPDVVTELSDLVAAHPLRERLVAASMRALAAAGRDSEALVLFQRTREALADALGADPSTELAALHVALLRGEQHHPGQHQPGQHQPGQAENTPREEPRRTNLRAELTSFVGKDTDVAAVRSLVADHRLTTLIGPGGSGKTRLATETARTLLGQAGSVELPDGAWLVELAAIGADGDVAQATLAGLGLRDALLGDASNSPAADPTERLIAAIREREALLVLDNCEHVIESAAVFAHRMLGECRRLRILATSREPLGITGEALWPVEPLALPRGGAGPDEIEASPAVRLLRDRASAVRRDLALPRGAVDARTTATLLRICRALDGMPLAIELAAARLRTMTVDQLAARLDDRFRLLTGGSRTALPRHRTLRAVVDWSWELLTDAERAVLRRLSVFVGGASLEAAEHVCAAVRTDARVGHVDPEDVLELLTSLTEKSLLRTEGESAGENEGESERAPRYRMLGTIREYAAQRLTEAGEAEAARRAHLAHYVELAEAADPHLRRVEQLEWLATLTAEHDDIAAAMRGALAAGEAEPAMRLAAGAGWYWWLGGHRSEGRELITAATELPGTTSGQVADEIRATVYALVTMFVSAGRGDAQQAAEWIHKAYELSTRVTGRGAGNRHPAPRLAAPLERLLLAPSEILSAWEPLLGDEDPWVRALARLHLGKMRIMLGDGGSDADAYLESALAAFQEIGERFGISFARSELADRLAVRGEFAAACEHYEQAITVVDELGATEDVIRLRALQARLYWLLGDEIASAAALAEAERCAEGVTWPDALAELALARAELARWERRGDETRSQLATARTLLGAEATQPHIRALTDDLLGYLTDDLDEARSHRAAACAAAAEAGHAPLVAQVLVGVADLALRGGEPGQAARLLGASVAVRGLPDRSNPDATRIEEAARNRLGEERFAEAVREGAGEVTRSGWPQLAEAALAD